MNENDIDLRSVNWQHGMLVTPAHFLRQERYIDSTFLWVLRYCTQAYGLTGAGPRLSVSERSAARHDPIIDAFDEGEVIKVSVSQCRGLSPSGDIIDIDAANPINGSISKKELDGISEVGIYVVCEPHDKIVEEELNDRDNPLMRSWRCHRYQVKLGITAAEAQHSLWLGLMKKSERSLQYEKDDTFIPMCTTMVSHSELMWAWQKLNEQLTQLAKRYTDLHKAILEYIYLAGPRGISIGEDDETLRFVDRMVSMLENCAYEILDPMQPPQQFFRQMDRVIRSSAVSLDLSPPTKDYFSQIADFGETQFDALLDQERQTLETKRELSIHNNLRLDVQRIENGLVRLGRLEEALEGKYLDYRVSPALEVLNFFFDRQTGARYQGLARQEYPQKIRQEITFVFSRLRLEGNQEYRLVLIGHPEARFELGSRLGAQIMLNVRSDQSHKPIHGKSTCEIPEQRNFAIDFVVPSDLHTVSDLRVLLDVSLQIKSCMLYIQKRLREPERHAHESPYSESEPMSEENSADDNDFKSRMRPVEEPQGEQ